MYYELPKRLFTEIEASDYISMSLEYLRRGRKNKLLPSDSKPAPRATQINGYTRYLREDLDAWINKLTKSKEGKQT